MKYPTQIGKKELVLALLSITFGWILFVKLIAHTSHQWQPFDAAYIQYDLKSGHDIKYYAVRKQEHGYLLAGDTPTELKLQFNFLESSNLRARVVSQYPDWKCSIDGIGQASIHFSSKSFERHFVLKQRSSEEFILKAIRGHPLKVSITNRTQEHCGRAEIFFETSPNHSVLVQSFVAFWVAISLIILFSGQAIIFVTIGLGIQLLSIQVASSYSSLVLADLLWMHGFATLLIGLLLIIKLIRIGWVRNALWLLVLCIPVTICGSFLGYYLSVGAPIDDDAIHAAMQTNFAESIDFLATQINWGVILATLAVPLSLLALLNLTERRQQLKNGGVIGISLVLLGSTLTLDRQALPSYIKLIERAASSYLFELDLFNKLKNQRELNETAVKSVRLKEGQQTLVVVIGESANKNHMGIYGYPRNTTPLANKLISEREMLRFDFAYSNHTHTNPALSQALTSADQYNYKSWVKSPSIINLANDAGINTFWISNQQLLGAWDNNVSLIAREAASFTSKNKLTGRARNAKKYDEILLRPIEKVVQAHSEATNLIFVHLQGSHALYCSRFPQDSAPFTGRPATANIFGKLAKYISRTNKTVINCYDNSIHYTDYILDQIAGILKKTNSPAALLYFADHSEDVINNKAHNSAVFSFSMAEIPLLFWSNKQWRKDFPLRWDGLSANTNKIFTNDHIFDTVAGLLGIESSEIAASNQLASERYIEALEPTTLHGRKRILSPDNTSYWQSKNLSMFNQEECYKLLPHRVNTIGKAREAIASGACGLEIDILIENNQDQIVFQVGHDTQALANMTLEEFFAQITISNIDKIWLDIKNLNQSLIPGTIQHLKYLDKKYDLNKKLLVETSFFGESTAQIFESGFKLSYYLPTGAIVKAMQDGELAQTELAQTLTSRITKTRANNISFDLRVYPFVKTHLEEILPSKDIAYHSWFPGDLRFHSPNLLSVIRQNDYFKDPKMQTILLPYSSIFSL